MKTSKRKVVIFGTTQMSQVAYFYLTHDSEYEVVAFSADKAYIKEETLLGLPLLPFEDIQRLLPPKKYSMYIAIGYSDLNALREARYIQAKEKGYCLITYISSKATVWRGYGDGSALIGDNTFIMENCIVQPYTQIGNNVVMWSGSTISHHSTLNNHCFLAPSSVVLGDVTIGSNCFIGANSTIRNGITVGDHTIVGAGALVVKDVEPYGLYRGAMSARSDKSSKHVHL